MLSINICMLQNKMSMTGSLMGYENNNDVNQAKCKKPLKPLPVVSSISSSGITTNTGKSKKARKSVRKESCIRGHVNSLWSVWYGILAVAFQAYIAMRYARRFAGKIAFPFISLKHALSSCSLFLFLVEPNVLITLIWKLTFLGLVILLFFQIKYQFIITFQVDK